MNTQKIQEVLLQKVPFSNQIGISLEISEDPYSLERDISEIGLVKNHFIKYSYEDIPFIETNLFEIMENIEEFQQIFLFSFTESIRRNTEKSTREKIQEEILETRRKEIEKRNGGIQTTLGEGVGCVSGEDFEKKLLPLISGKCDGTISEEQFYEKLKDVHQEK